MFGLLAGLHALLFRGVLWLLKLPLKALWALLLSVVALLGEETRRWLGVVMAGLMILAVSWATLKVAADQQVALLLVMLMGLLWLRAVFFAAHLTAQNRVWKVRQRQMFKELKGEVDKLGDRLGDVVGDARDGLAKRTRGTPFGGVFRTNRDRDRDEQAQREIAAQREAEEQLAQAEQVAAERRAKQARDRWAEQVAAEHDPFEKQGA